MKIVVVRHEFYENSRRYTEKTHNVNIRYCYEIINSRPENQKPRETQDYIILYDFIKGRRSVTCLGDFQEFAFYEGPKDLFDIEIENNTLQNIKYYNFSKIYKNRIDFFTNKTYKTCKILFGNKIDIYNFFNGHSTSRIVNLKEIKKDQVWLHYNTWGKECIDFLEENADNWWKFKKSSDELNNYVNNLTGNVYEKLEILENNSWFLEEANWCKDFLCNILETSEFYQKLKKFPSDIDGLIP